MRSNNKKKVRTANNDTFPQYFMRLLGQFKYIPYIGYRKRQVKNEPTEYYFFLVLKKTALLKNKKLVLLRNEIIKYGVVNKKHANEVINSGNI